MTGKRDMTGEKISEVTLTKNENEYIVLDLSDAGVWTICGASVRHNQKVFFADDLKTRIAAMIREISGSMLSDGRSYNYVKSLILSPANVDLFAAAGEIIKDYAERYVAFVRKFTDGADYDLISVERFLYYEDRFQFRGTVSLFTVKDNRIRVTDLVIVTDDLPAVADAGRMKFAQMMLHAQLIMYYYEIPDADVELILFRPHDNNASYYSYRTSRKPLSGFVADTGRYVSGSHCQFCRHVMACEEFRNKYKFFYNDSKSGEMKQEYEQVLYDILEHAPAVEYYINNAKEEVKKILVSGGKFGDWKIVRKRDMDTWGGNFTPAEIARKLGLKVADITERRLLSPEEVERKMNMRIPGGLGFINEFYQLDNGKPSFPAAERTGQDQKYPLEIV